MPVITSRGRELARYIGQFVGGETDHLREICSLIARSAATHHRLQEAQCNRELRPSELRQEEFVERHIRELVATLPPLAASESPHGNRITVEFSGDPRGYTVKLVVPGDNGGNTWGLAGRYGV